LHNHEDQQRIKEKSGGAALADIVGSLLAAIDPDRIDDKALEIAAVPAGTEPGDQARQTAREQLVGKPHASSMVMMQSSLLQRQCVRRSG